VVLVLWWNYGRRSLLIQGSGGTIGWQRWIVDSTCEFRKVAYSVVMLSSFVVVFSDCFKGFKNLSSTTTGMNRVWICLHFSAISRWSRFFTEVLNLGFKYCVAIIIISDLLFCIWSYLSLRSIWHQPYLFLNFHPTNNNKPD